MRTEVYVNVGDSDSSGKKTDDIDIRSNISWINRNSYKKSQNVKHTESVILV